MCKNSNLQLVVLSIFFFSFSILNKPEQPEAQTSDTPEFEVESVISSVSGQAEKVAPGSLITLKGVGLSGDGKECSAALDKTLPTELCGTIVSTDRIYSEEIFFPIFSVKPAEITLQVPYDISSRRQYLCIVHGLISELSEEEIEDNDEVACIKIKVSSQDPVIVEKDGIARAFHKDGTSITAASPAVAGERIFVTVSGLGRSRPASEDGEKSEENALVKKPKVVLLSSDSKSRPKSVRVVRAAKQPGEVGIDNIEITIPNVAGLTKDKVSNYQLQLGSNLKTASNKAILPLIGRADSSSAATVSNKLTVQVNNSSSITINAGDSYTLTAKIGTKIFNGLLDAMSVVCQIGTTNCASPVQITAWGNTTGDGSITWNLPLTFPAGIYKATFRPTDKSVTEWSNEVIVRVNNSQVQVPAVNSTETPTPTVTPSPTPTSRYVCLDNIPPNGPDTVRETVLRQSGAFTDEQICNIEWERGVPFHSSWSAAFVNCKFWCCFGYCKPR